MTAFKRHSFKESGNAYNVALALALAGLPWEKVFVYYCNGKTRQTFQPLFT